MTKILPSNHLRVSTGKECDQAGVVVVGYVSSKISTSLPLSFCPSGAAAQNVAVSATLLLCHRASSCHFSRSKRSSS
jgi:hypothetical protein